MPKYIVAVRYYFEKDITVWAKDEAAAKDKAEEIVGNWNGVLDAEAQDCFEE